MVGPEEVIVVREETTLVAPAAAMDFVLTHERMTSSLVSLYSIAGLVLAGIALAGVGETVLPRELVGGAFATAAVLIVGALASAIVTRTTTPSALDLDAERLEWTARRTGYIQLIGVLAPIVGVIAAIVMMRGE